MLAGWLERGFAAGNVIVVDPDQAADRLPAQVRLLRSPEELPEDFIPDVVVLAVKPQVMDRVLPPYAAYPGAVFLSIAAGKPLAYFARHLGAATAVVRAMPNTPAAVGRGITVAAPNPIVTLPQRQACDALLAAVGEVAWVDDEGLMDAVTAVSGSGPAYVFLLVEALAAAAIEAGLPEDLAAQLARATVVGSGELLRQSPDSAAVLRTNVTSPGGTTFAALQVLMGEDGLQSLLTRAVAAATRRSRELAG